MKPLINHKKGIDKMKFDEIAEVPFPDTLVWGEYYEKFCKPLVASLDNRYMLADREDAVEEAFYKLMHKKDRDAYGDNMPRTEKGWFYALRWQARSYLSHMKDRGKLHARYVEEASKELADMFVDGRQGEVGDAEVRSRALALALEILRAEQDISRRDLSIYLAFRMRGENAKVVGVRHGVSSNNATVIKFRIGRILRKHGPRCFERALQKAQAELCMAKAA